MESIGDVVIRRRRIIFAAALGFAAAAWWTAPPLAYEQDVAAMFPPDDEHRIATETLRRVFGGEAVVLAVYTDEQLLTPQGAKRPARAGRGPARDAGRRVLLWIVDDESGGGRLVSGETRRADSHDGERLSARARRADGGHRVSAGLGTASIWRAGVGASMRCGARWSAKRPKACLRASRSCSSTATDSSRMTEGCCSFATTGVLAASTLYMFPSLAYGLAPLVIVAWVLQTSRAVIAWCGMPMSMISSMVTAMTAILGVAATMHWLVRRQSLAAAGGAAGTIGRADAEAVGAADDVGGGDRRGGVHGAVGD